MIGDCGFVRVGREWRFPAVSVAAKHRIYIRATGCTFKNGELGV